MSRDEQKKGLLKRWLQGDANLNDEQQLERLAADDPFLAEAIEGYRSMPEGQHLKNIQELKNRFNKKESNKGLILPLYLMRIAAGVAILVLSVIAFQWVNNDSSDTLAQKNEAPAEESIAENDIDADSDGIVDLTFDEEGQEQETQYFIDPNMKANNNGDVNGDPLQIKPNLFPKQKKETRPGSIEGAIALQEESVEIALDDADMAADIEPTIAPEPEAFTLEDVAMKDAAVEEISIPSMPLDILPDSTTAYVLNGRVENSAGDPLIGATISVVNSSNNAITDFNGDFKISLQDTQRGQLQIDYVGYKPQTILANNQKNVKVILQEAQALDEVTVAQEEARMSRKKSSSAKKDFINSAPKPITGFKNYKQYIQKELTYPRLARENNIQGTVRLEFFVDGSGTPTNFRVLKTLGFGCDAEAMLLLENGPKWSHPGKVVYEVEFKL